MSCETKYKCVYMMPCQEELCAICVCSPLLSIPRVPREKKNTIGFWLSSILMSAQLVHPLLLRPPGSPSCHPCSVHAEGAHGCDDPHGSVHGQLKHRVSSWNMYQLSKKYERDAPCEWMAHDTQYAILMYNFGITYSNNIKTSIPIQEKMTSRGGTHPGIQTLLRYPSPPHSRPCF